MRTWHVITPEYRTFRGSDMEPPEYGCDVIEIEAATKRDAIRLGVVEMLKGGRRGFYGCYGYCLEQRDNDASPYTGVWAEEVPYEYPEPADDPEGLNA